MGYITARTPQEACAALAAGARLIAGGTDWFPAAGDVVGDVALLDVSPLPGMREITRSGGQWRIGAAVTWSDVMRADLPGGFDGLRAAGHEVGSVQIQNAGTVVGNLCNASPAADGVPALLVLGALVECLSPAGRRVLPLQDFILGPRRTALGPEEFVTALLIPDPPEDARAVFQKAGARRYLVISIAMVAVIASVRDGRLADVRLAVGACGPVARRLSGLEARLEGVDKVPPITAADLDELAPIDDVRGSAGYRREVVAEMLARALEGLL